jgi:hypothetical protein
MKKHTDYSTKRREAMCAVSKRNIKTSIFILLLGLGLIACAGLAATPAAVLPTQTPAITPTPMPPTSTPKPSDTPIPPTPTDTPAPTNTPQLTPFVEPPSCTEKTVLPIIADVQPSPALPGSEITITGAGGYLQDSCGGINESARSFKLYLDNEPVGDLLCYVNRCETKINLAGSIVSKSYCLSTQKGVCEFQFQIGSE